MMFEIEIKNLGGKKLTIDDSSGSFLNIFQKNRIDWMHSCGGKGRCTTCRMRILSGLDHITPRSPFEKKCVEKGFLQKEERLACQCRPKGTVTISVPNETKLPHLNYSD